MSDKYFTVKIRAYLEELFSTKGKTDFWEHSTGICTGDHIQSPIFRRRCYGIS